MYYGREHLITSVINISFFKPGTTTSSRARIVEEKCNVPVTKSSGLIGLNEMYGGVLGNLVSLTAQTTGCDFLPTDPVQREIQIREKYWGEILERTVSSHNLQTGMVYSPINSPAANNTSGIVTARDKKLSSSSPFLSGISYQL